MSKTKRYISFIVEIILIFSIIFSVLAIFVKSVALNKNTYLNILNKNNAYSNIKDSIYERMDKVLGSDIDNDIKETIIAEEDIKREADTLITGLTEYLKTGENNIDPIDTKIYEERVEKAVNLILADLADSSSKDLSFNDTQLQDMALTKNELQFNSMLLFREVSKSGQDSLYIEKLMSSSEAEDKIRGLLKEKGLTEAEARQKMSEKGITREQALEILEGYGITIDDEINSGRNGSSSNSNNNENDASSENPNNNQSKDTQGNNNSENQSSSDNVVQGQESGNITNHGVMTEESGNSDSSSGVSFISKLQNEIIDAIITNDGKTIEEKLTVIEDKVSDEVKNKMNAEIEKMNLNKVLESGKVEKLAKITSAFYKMFWLFMILPIVLILILAKLNNWKLRASLRWVGSGFVLAGLFIFIISFGAYLSKFYENINIDFINMNGIYVKDIIFATIKHLLRSMSILGIIAFFKGLILLIPTIKRFNK